MNFYPVRDRLLISYEEVERRTAGGLIIPDTAQKKSQIGTVVRVGNSVRTYGAGDRVLFAQYSGIDIVVDDVKYLVIKEEDVLGFFGKGADAKEEA